MNTRRILALLLVAVMLFSAVGCSEKKNEEVPTPPEQFVYKNSVETLANNWNPHVYQSSYNSYPLNYITTSFYGFDYNDETRPVSGKEPFESYVFTPEMAAALPEDVTEKVKAEKPALGIPESASSGFAYKIALNPNAVFSNGKKITASTYVESFKRLLNPDYLNYRAEKTLNGDILIVGFENYLKQGTSYVKKLGISAEQWLSQGNKLEDLYVNVNSSMNVKMPDGSEWAKVTDTTVLTLEDGSTTTPKTIYEELYAEGKDPDAVSARRCGFLFVYEDNYSWDENVGLYASGEYELTVVLKNALSGYYLIYNLNTLTQYLVEPELYDSCMQEKDGVWTSTYGTSVDTTVSFGPYKLTEFNTDKSMRFGRNDTWYGYTDGKHTYKDKYDGKTYNMYQTTEIYTQVVAENSTRKEMFLAGQLMEYNLKDGEMETYRNSDFLFKTPLGDISFLFLNGHKDKINEREAEKDFDSSKEDIQSILAPSFRKALAVSFDRSLLAETVFPTRSATYGLIGELYISDVDTASSYRNSEQAKKALCDFYGVDVTKYSSLDEAVKAITGYDPEEAARLFDLAFNEAISAGYITDADGDGKSDQTVTLSYGIVTAEDTKAVQFLNDSMARVTKGTAFEGKIIFEATAPMVDTWFNNLKAGAFDVKIMNWDGNVLNPFNLPMLYTYPMSLDAAWFDASSVNVTMTVNVGGLNGKEMKEVTMNMVQWTDALNGAPVTIEGVTYNFGSDGTDLETRLTILAGLEKEVLSSYTYLPMIQNSTTALLSQQVYYAVEEYNPIIGRGGMRYLRYNYNEQAWSEYVKQCGGQLSY